MREFPKKKSIMQVMKMNANHVIDRFARKLGVDEVGENRLFFRSILLPLMSRFIILKGSTN